MDKNSYNIDSILSEVKKRREEQEDKLSSPSENRNIKNSMSVDADLKAAPQAQEPAPVVEPKAEEQPQADEPLPEVDEKEQEIETDLTADGEEEAEMPYVSLDDGEEEVEMPPVSLDDDESEPIMPSVSDDSDTVDDSAM